MDDHSNEITAMPELLEMLVLEGNQAQLHEAVVETFAVEQAEPSRTATTTSTRP